MPFHRHYYELHLRKKTIKLRLPWTEASARSHRDRDGDGDVIAAERAPLPAPAARTARTAGRSGIGAASGPTTATTTTTTTTATRQDRSVTSEGTQTEPLFLFELPPLSPLENTLTLPQRPPQQPPSPPPPPPPGQTDDEGGPRERQPRREVTLEPSPTAIDALFPPPTPSPSPAPAPARGLGVTGATGVTGASGAASGPAIGASGAASGVNRVPPPSRLPPPTRPAPSPSLSQAPAPASAPEEETLPTISPAASAPAPALVPVPAAPATPPPAQSASSTPPARLLPSFPPAQHHHQHHPHPHPHHRDCPPTPPSPSDSLSLSFSLDHDLPALSSSFPSSPIVAATIVTTASPLPPSTPPSPLTPYDSPIRIKPLSTAMPPPPALLNPEPAAPADRKALHLPPKSYADAAEEALEPPRAPSPASEDATEHKHQGSPTFTTSEPSVPEERAAHDLPPKSYAEAAEDGLELPHGSEEHRQPKIDGIHANGRLSIPQDREHYEGEGQDNFPRSPTRGLKKKASQKVNGSMGQKQGDHAGYEVYEKYQNGNGHSLTSAKPPYEYEKDARRDDRPQDQQLTTGREAGAGWHTSKIRWAPFNVPVKRRLQTLAVLMHTLSIAGLVGIFFFLCSIPLLWPILVPYLVYALMSNAGTSGELYFRSERARRLPVWSLFASYYPMRLHRVQALEPTRKYIFGYHPHGIISHGAFAAFATEALGFSQLFPGITNTLLTLDSNFRLPLYREYALRMGLASVSRESIINILSRGGTNGEGMGRAVTIVIGGAREALEARPGHMRLVIQRRKGFAKLALRTGADLVPVLAFGENDIYDQFDVASRPYVKKLQMLVKKVAGFTTPLFHARGIFNYDVGLMPYRKPINIVVGKPIRVKQDTHPDQKTVDALHGQYVAELQRLYDEWKDTFAKDRVEEMKFIE